MNARLQRLWFLVRWLAGVGVGVRWGWGWGLAVVLAYPLALLPCFAVLPWINRGPQAPRWGELWRAWWREVLASERSFGWRQPWRTHAEADHLPPGAQAGVLFLHGFCCNRAFWNGWMPRLREQQVAFIAPSLEPAFGSVDDYAEVIEAAVQRLHALTGRMPMIVCHSMGGLAARAWWRRFGGGAVPAVITLGTPHAGSLLARFSPALNAQQMRWHSDWVGALPVIPGTLCVWTPCDPLVVPARSAILPGSPSHRVDGVGHVGLVFDERVWAVVQAAVASALSTPRRI